GVHVDVGVGVGGGVGLLHENKTTTVKRRNLFIFGKSSYEDFPSMGKAKTSAHRRILGTPPLKGSSYEKSSSIHQCNCCSQKFTMPLARQFAPRLTRIYMARAFVAGASGRPATGWRLSQRQ